MAKTYGEDLRSRVIAAVDGGMWHGAAAVRFEVGKAAAIAWLRAWRDEGRNSAKPKGGDTRSHRIEAFAPVILAAVEARRAARTIPALWKAIAAALPAFSPAECANYFTACGYAPD